MAQENSCASRGFSSHNCIDKAAVPWILCIERGNVVLLNLIEILADARKNEYAVFATNAFNFEKLITPLISLAKDASVPVMVNLDHGNNMGIIMKCIDAGVSSVMFDGSTLPLETNIRITRELT